MAANELGRARISMMVRSISSNTRPDTLVQDRTLQLTFSLATHGGSIHMGQSQPAPPDTPVADVRYCSKSGKAQKAPKRFFRVPESGPSNSPYRGYCRPNPLCGVNRIDRRVNVF